MTSEGEDFRRVADRVLAELSQPIFPAAEAACRDLLAAHPGAAAILFYGSCLRSGADDDKILDFYVLADDLAEANGSALLGFFNRVLPPNVFYRETPFEGRMVRTKYALMSTEGFAESMRLDCLNPSFWARFAQPCALAWVRDPRTGGLVADAVAQAVITAVSTVAPVHPSPFTPDELWSHVFQMTYAAEFRSENAATKGGEIFREYPDRYRELAVPAMRASGIEVSVDEHGFLRTAVPASRARQEIGRWRTRRLQGKTLSLLRLIKGAFTFTGGLDYLAWKMRRHSGVDIKIKPWHRRHPIIGGLVLIRKARRKGGFR
ncbi:hypothetical protein [Emcibacter sp. SYSU 3D8]|uniref:hypothetical protein n=1 Tax=Emcibacter sp. SYSU 3D8 TaxID=3133969 RepID=UPI0031FE445F